MMGKSLYEFSKDKGNHKKNIDEKIKNSKIEELLKENKNIGGLGQEELKKKIKNYSKLSQSDLMRELQNEITKQKANGSFDINNLSSQLSNVKSMLDEKQRANLERILKNLK
jgi:hypothetical protein